MLSFGDKAILKAELFPPRIGFDADNLKFSVIKTDDRDISSLSYSIAGSGYKDITAGKFIPYNLSKIDTYYNLSVKQTPRDKKYKGNTTTLQIFKNHEDCKYFKYTGNNYESTDIYAYTGLKSNVYIPDKHNMVYTRSATILEFPTIKAEGISISTGVGMEAFNIRDDRITSFNLRGSLLKPIPYQFANFPNLIEITGDLPVCSDYMFYNSSGLEMNPNCTKNMTKIGTKAFFNLPKQKVVRISASEIPAESFGYDQQFEDTNLQKVIFTEADSINGYTQDTLYYASPRQGMIYTDPNDGKEKYHQVYCGLTDNAWEDEPYENDLVYLDSYDIIGNNLYNLNFKAEDPRVIGLKVRIFSIGGTEKATKVWLPQNVDTDTVKNYFEREYNAKYFHISQTQFGDGYFQPNRWDRYDIQAIGQNGLGAEYTSTLYGLLKDLSGVPIIPVVYTAGINTPYEVIINDGEYRYNPSYVEKAQYKLYLTCEPEYESIMMVMYNENETARYKGKDGEEYQLVELGDLQPLQIGGRRVFVVDLTKYYSTDYLNKNSNNILRLSYAGYLEPYYKVDLGERKLTGYTENLVVIDGFVLSAQELTMRPKGVSLRMKAVHPGGIKPYTIYLSGEEFLRELSEGETITVFHFGTERDYTWDGTYLLGPYDDEPYIPTNTDIIIFEDKKYYWNGTKFVHHPALEVNRLCFTEAIVSLKALKEDEVNLTAVYRTDEETAKATMLINIKEQGELGGLVAMDSMEASRGIQVAACVPGLSSATVSGIDTREITFWSTSTKTWRLWLAQDLDADITAELYNSSGVLLGSYDLESFYEKSYTYSSTKQYNLISWPQKDSSYYLKCWYTHNASKGTFTIPLTKKTTYNKNS